MPKVYRHIRNRGDWWRRRIKVRRKVVEPCRIAPFDEISRLVYLSQSLIWLYDVLQGWNVDMCSLYRLAVSSGEEALGLRFDCL